MHAQVGFLGVCANESVVRAALHANEISSLKRMGYTVARKGEVDSFRRELGPSVVAQLNRRVEAIMQVHAPNACTHMPMPMSTCPSI